MFVSCDPSRKIGGSFDIPRAAANNLCTMTSAMQETILFDLCYPIPKQTRAVQCCKLNRYFELYDMVIREVQLPLSECPLQPRTSTMLREVRNSNSKRELQKRKPFKSL